MIWSGLLIGRGGFKHVNLPAIAISDETFVIGSNKKVGRKAGEALHPSRESVAQLSELKTHMGSADFAAQYQQEPVPAEGNMIKAGWFTYYTPEQLPTAFDTVFQSWDTANKLTDCSDYSVCTTWGVYQRKLYLLHVLRERMDFPTLTKRAIAHRDGYGAQTVLIEDKASGIQLLQELRSQGIGQVTGVEPEGDKQYRMQGQTVLFENKIVLLPSDAPWLSVYVHELLSFPNGKHDDQVDSTSQALSWFNPRSQDPGLLQFYSSKLAERDAQNASRCTPAAVG